MAKRTILEEGMLLSICLNDTTWTVGQVCNVFRLEGRRYEQHTMAFFNCVFNSEEELIANVNNLDLSRPIIILTTNGHPVRIYKLDVIGKREINYLNVPNYKDDISKTLGTYKNNSSDFDHILSTYFGLHPWDGWPILNYINNKLTPGTVKRSDVKYMKDFSIEELKNIMNPNNIKLIEYLKQKE